MNAPDALNKVREVIAALLGPDGCPWDRKQTPASLCDYVVEEAYELVEAVRAGDAEAAMEEIGDVAFLLLFMAELYGRAGNFGLAEALHANAAKMIRRHPHVFGDASVADQSELLRNWERIKRSEKPEGEARRVFASLPKGLPPLLRSYRIQSKSARVGFTFPSDQEAAAQFRREMEEMDAALAAGDKEAAMEEYGDALFALVEIGRRHGLKANEALDFANRKFLRRFAAMEDLADAGGLDLATLPLPEQNRLWAEVKAEEGRTK